MMPWTPESGCCDSNFRFKALRQSIFPLKFKLSYYVGPCPLKASRGPGMGDETFCSSVLVCSSRQKNSGKPLRMRCEEKYRTYMHLLTQKNSKADYQNYAKHNGAAIEILNIKSYNANKTMKGR